MSPNGKTQKVIGTLVPLSALSSLETPQNQGTFATGMVFLDWIHLTGQNAWQMLPLHQTQLEKGSANKHVPSPYKGYGVGLDPKYLGTLRVSKVSRVSKALDTFIRQNGDWIGDYALFCALRDQFGTDDWRTWETGLIKRDKETLAKWSKKLEKEIENNILIQYELHGQYKQLKNKAKKLDILLIGDLPFYLSINSPLVWAHQDVFRLENNGKMHYVSGIPDTPSAHFGRQIWGHPLYKWGTAGNNKKIIAFWKIRLRYLSLLFDSIRFDHAKGLFDYGVLDPANKESDRYIAGPGFRVFEELLTYSRELGMSVFVEDSGENLSTLRSSLAKLKIAGIKIFRFALNEKKKKLNKEYADVASYPTNTIAYTTTHDTESLLSYLKILNLSQKQKLAAYADIEYFSDDFEFAAKLRDAIISSPAHMVIIPMQDYLLTTDRINIPGTEKEISDPNWQYKLKTPIEKLPEGF